EKSIWMFVYLAGGGYTIYSGIQLTEQYYSYETYSRVTLMMNKSITLPPTSLCMFIDYFTSESLNLRPNEPGVVKAFYSNRLTEFFNSTKNEELFLQENYVWPTEVLFVIYQYLGIIEEAEKCSSYADFCSIDEAIYGRIDYGLF